eukprot:243101-Hanusia_phi.AAC.1
MYPTAARSEKAVIAYDDPSLLCVTSRLHSGMKIWTVEAPCAPASSLMRAQWQTLRALARRARE